MDQMGSVQSDKSSGEHNQPSEEADVRMILIWNPLGEEAPENTKWKTNENLNGPVHGELQSICIFVESNAQEYPEATNSDHIISCTGRNDQSWNSLCYTIASERESFLLKSEWMSCNIEVQSKSYFILWFAIFG